MTEKSNIRVLPRPDVFTPADVEDVIHAALADIETSPIRGVVVFTVDHSGTPMLRYAGQSRTELAGALFRAALEVGRMEEQ